MHLMKPQRQPRQAPRIVTPRTAILCGPQDLLSEAIESFLTTVENWQVIKIFDGQDVHLLCREVEKVKPEIIILNQGQGSETLLSPLHLIENFPELRVITINSRNNLMEVYNKQTVCIKEAIDLLSIIGE